MLPPDPPSSIAALVSRTKYENVATRPAVVDRSASVANEIRKFCYPNRCRRCSASVANEFRKCCCPNCRCHSASVAVYTSTLSISVDIIFPYTSFLKFM
ncbi:unnamed protein product [Macrosiphum euphorbiae]|uniref:Uncharacterized protein n=1 Tax=Macrosiphum euphorbiae TaxID=13131 RepID=A0AAV0Y062_9HEMI|nr:unnamed protein product [Macrosiphum euphorbiae]